MSGCSSQHLDLHNINSRTSSFSYNHVRVFFTLNLLIMIITCEVPSLCHELIIMNSWKQTISVCRPSWNSDHLTYLYTWTMLTRYHISMSHPSYDVTIDRRYGKQVLVTRPTATNVLVCHVAIWRHGFSYYHASYDVTIYIGDQVTKLSPQQMSHALINKFYQLLFLRVMVNGWQK